MKKLLSILLLTIPFFGFGQSMNISWEDRDGREFSINTHSGNFQYSMISGDKIDYNDKYDDRHKSGIVGKVKSIGNVKIVYYEKYDDRHKSGIVGKVKSVGNVKIVYYEKYDDRHKSGIVGYIKAVGGLKVYYNEKYDDGPLGSIKNSSGSVN